MLTIEERLGALEAAAGQNGMRQLIVDQIRSSSTWQKCLDDEELSSNLPDLEKLSDRELLAQYDWNLFGYHE